ncbi:hypothetical protein O3Q52_05925 [Streptomyces sp. ActVer]|uniref:hypothetical protein n=1 Tax=Streptomyces sp. ActVer TaxID=3014558 RepID=UPI0022B5B3B3|nr:hypothetical protein [Streptomyces sp. ActVer]MCZ4507754.1 hypothetical protein [Streptomyces sp. ActVer]
MPGRHSDQDEPRASVTRAQACAAVQGADGEGAAVQHSGRSVRVQEVTVAAGDEPDLLGSLAPAHSDLGAGRQLEVVDGFGLGEEEAAPGQ